LLDTDGADAGDFVNEAHRDCRRELDIILDWAVAHLKATPEQRTDGVEERLGGRDPDLCCSPPPCSVPMRPELAYELSARWRDS
jgi:hypothetical protein